MNVDAPSTKKVTFAPDSKPTPPESSASSTRTSAIPENQPSSANESEIKVDGIIGQLEVHQSGAVKMRLGNGIVMDVCKTLIGADSHLPSFI
jgi:DNA-directed RNA polymerase III subunit RPC4